MNEREAVEASTGPVTVETLETDLRNLGLVAGDVVLLHSSLSSLGWVCGGSTAVVTALLAVLGPAATIVVPTQSGGLSDPADWQNPPVPEAWWETIRHTMPAYAAASTPSRGMGAIAELVRTWPGARRSDHPHVSFAALGPLASDITAPHELTSGLGESSPLGRLYEADARVLLLGVGYERSTALHLAEYRSGVRAQVAQSGPLTVQGHRRWVTWADIDLDSTDFARVGADFEAGGQVRIGRVGHADARLMRMRAAVDDATGWFRRNAGPI